MKEVVANSGILSNSENWQKYLGECESLKSELLFYSKDLRFFQQLLNRYFDTLIKTESLDELRESLMRFQDVCYDCDRLKKRVKDQKERLNELINGFGTYEEWSILKEQEALKQLKNSLLKEFTAIKKEMFLIADHMTQVSKKNGNFPYPA